MTSLGLREKHKLLDIGCGSLRMGRLFIPYLNVGNYVGVEPNEWLVRDGIKYETGQDQVDIKKSRFYFADTTSGLPDDEMFDYALAHSILTHSGLDIIKQWLFDVSTRLNDEGVLVATIKMGDKDSEVQGWVYPECLKYRMETLSELARDVDLDFFLVNWTHPTQTWVLFAKPDFPFANYT
jgi:cyclopropane fatty-acyl-phospholipid synthase-like methyltransferase